MVPQKLLFGGLDQETRREGTAQADYFLFGGGTEKGVFKTMDGCESYAYYGRAGRQEGN